MEGYTEKEKAIFPYFDGKKNRFADPVTVRRRLAQALAPQSLEEVLVRCKDKDATISIPAKEEILGAIRSAFEMPFNPDAATVEEYGATDNECVAAINAYLDFNKKKERTGEKPPTSPEPTGFTFPARIGSVTKRSMASGSTSDASARKERGNTPTEAG